MNFKSVKNVRWANPEKTKISMEVDFDFLPDDWVPFIATPDYDMDYGRVLFSDAIAGKFGPIAEFIPPPPKPKEVVSSVSPWQMRKALNRLNLRDAVESLIKSTTDYDIKDGWEYATEFRRADPFVIRLGTALGKSPEDLDAIFELAASL